MAQTNYYIGETTNSAGESEINLRLFVSRNIRLCIGSGIWIDRKRWGKKDEINIPLIQGRGAVTVILSFFIYPGRRAEHRKAKTNCHRQTLRKGLRWLWPVATKPVVKQVPPFLFPLIVNRGISLHNDRGGCQSSCPLHSIAKMKCNTLAIY